MPQRPQKLVPPSDPAAIQRGQLKGRAALANPPNRFERTHREDDYDQLSEEELAAPPRPAPTQFLPDQSQSLLVQNDSPDIPFRWSMNPYRGCEHGCAYCYARPSHEMLGFGSGLDFETKIMVKHQAPSLLRKALAAPRWQPELIALSGNTDCYQPAERQFRITRGLLEVALEARQPVGILTKNRLILRDLDLLAEMARRRLVHVGLSVTTLDAELARKLEPRTASPAARLEAIRQLTAAGVPVRAMLAPIVPGLTDSELPALLEAVGQAGAHGASYILLRLPQSVKTIFGQWLAEHAPLQAERVESRIRDSRGGEIDDSQFGRRMRGQGPYAEQIAQTFRVFAAKYKLDGPLPEYDFSQFRPPREPSGQMWLFE